MYYIYMLYKNNLQSLYIVIDELQQLNYRNNKSRVLYKVAIYLIFKQKCI